MSASSPKEVYDGYLEYCLQFLVHFLETSSFINHYSPVSILSILSETAYREYLL